MKHSIFILNTPLISISIITTKQLKEDQGEVKKELKKLTKEFESLRAKIADKLDCATSPKSVDVPHLSDTCDGFSTTMES